jgi:hypothetical protein
MDIDFGPSDCLVYSPVLNFLQYNLERGAEDAVILKSAVDFFELTDIAKGKKLLWEKLLISEACPKRTGPNAPINHLKDMLELIQRMKTGSNPILLVSVIRSPTGSIFTCSSLF